MDHALYVALNIKFPISMLLHCQRKMQKCNVLMTLYNSSSNSAGGNFGVKFWFLPKEGNELEEKAELPTGKSQIVNVTWNQNQSDQIAVLSQNTSQIHNFDGSSVQV